MPRQGQDFLLHCGFSPDWKINPNQISQEALENVVKTTADIFSMPMSYVFNKVQQTFYFIVHIPLTGPEQVRDMFE